MADIPPSEIEELLRKIREQYDSLKPSSKTDLDNEYRDLPPISLNQELSFSAESAIVSYLGRGWGKPEETRIWSAAKESDLILKFPKSEHDLLIIFRGHYFLPDDRKSTPIDLFLNGRLIARWEENNSSPLSTLILRDQLTESGIGRLVFRFEKPISPASLNISNDHRLLGYSFSSLFIKEIK